MKVNPIFIDEFVSPLIGGADRDNEFEYFKCNPDLEQDVKFLCNNLLIPEFKQQIEQIREVAKNTLAYYLFYKTFDFHSKLDSLLLPMKTPNNSVLFFLWLWNEFFDRESFDYIKNEMVVEEFNVDEPLKLIMKHKNK